MISIYVSMYICMYSVVTATSCCVPGAKALVRGEGRIAFSGSLVEVKAATQHTQRDWQKQMPDHHGQEGGEKGAAC